MAATTHLHSPNIPLNPDVPLAPAADVRGEWVASDAPGWTGHHRLT
ncbi:MAG: hypothetical protein ABIQ18_49325 [Umezawaea sp.]